MGRIFQFSTNRSSSGCLSDCDPDDRGHLQPVDTVGAGILIGRQFLDQIADREHIGDSSVCFPACGIRLFS